MLWIVVLWIVLLISILGLYWIYDGYGRFLQVCSLVYGAAPVKTREAATIDTQKQLPSITVLLTVHNEERVIEDRIQNLLQCDYPRHLLDILVASDGSTDRTAEIVSRYADSGVRLLESPGLGKTATQNLAFRQIESELVVFTDADIQFDTGFLRQIAGPFADPLVGAVDGRLLYTRDEQPTTVVGQGFYWNYELKVRYLESRMGLLAVVAGACFALRRKLFVPMDPSIGEDCIVPLDVVSQGYLVLHEPTAVAYDRYDDSAELTLRRRIRMTLRNWQGTWTRPALLNPLKKPGYAFALWSHKLLRWLSPVFLGLATCSATGLLVAAPGWLSILAVMPFVMLFGLAASGWMAGRTGLRLPGAGTAFSFVLANTAFMIGIWRATLGERIHSYRNG
ncbi:MAG: glycosyltransferase [Planctomyces sp.]|nr:glycosyltransferase [Planctomyces sp.]